MKKISAKTIQQHIKNGFAFTSQSQEKQIDQIWEQPVQKASGEEWFLDGIPQEAPKKNRKITGWISLAAACFAICLLCILPANLQTSAMIYLDVNPSLSISVNKNEKVLDVVANNADGEKILDGMDLSHTDLNTTVNALIGSMVKHGYLSEAQNTVLVSVDGKDADLTNTLRTAVSDDIYSSMQSLLGAGSVLDQSIETTDSLTNLAETYRISPGKAWLIYRLSEVSPDLTFEDLAPLPISELILRLKEAGVDLRQYVNYHGTFDDDWFDDLFDAFDDLDDVYDDLDDIDDTIDDVDDTIDDVDDPDFDYDDRDDDDAYDNDDRYASGAQSKTYQDDDDWDDDDRYDYDDDDHYDDVDDDDYDDADDD